VPRTTSGSPDPEVCPNSRMEGGGVDLARHDGSADSPEPERVDSRPDDRSERPPLSTSGPGRFVPAGFTPGAPSEWRGMGTRRASSLSEKRGAARRGWPGRRPGLSVGEGPAGATESIRSSGRDASVDGLLSASGPAGYGPAPGGRRGERRLVRRPPASGAPRRKGAGARSPSTSADERT
jgi:hypothetical protein